MSYPQSNYPEPAPYTPTVTSSNAVISLICAILGWVGVFGLGGILAVIFGHIAKNEIRKNAGRVTGDGMATAGLVLGYANVAISLFGCCLFILMFTGMISAPLLCAPFFNELNTTFSLLP